MKRYEAFTVTKCDRTAADYYQYTLYQSLATTEAQTNSVLDVW